MIDNIYKILHNKFDIITHKNNFINYLEIVILEDGTIEYAIPSHQEKLINICLNKYNISRFELESVCPPEYYGDYINWLCKMSKAICVWNDFYKGDLNNNQKYALSLLKRSGLYTGKI